MFASATSTAEVAATIWSETIYKRACNLRMQVWIDCAAIYLRFCLGDRGWVPMRRRVLVTDIDRATAMLAVYTLSLRRPRRSLWLVPPSYAATGGYVVFIEPDSALLRYALQRTTKATIWRRCGRTVADYERIGDARSPYLPPRRMAFQLRAPRRRRIPLHDRGRVAMETWSHSYLVGSNNCAK